VCVFEELCLFDCMVNYYSLLQCSSRSQCFKDALNGVGVAISVILRRIMTFFERRFNYVHVDMLKLLIGIEVSVSSQKSMASRL